MSSGVAQEAFANIGVSMLTMVNMLAGGVDLTMFNGARPAPTPQKDIPFPASAQASLRDGWRIAIEPCPAVVTSMQVSSGPRSGKQVVLR